MLRQTVLFNGTDASGRAGIWETNGTAAGTYELTGVVDGVFNPADFVAFNGEVLFQGQDTSGLYGIWKTDGTAAGTTEIGGFGSTGISGVNSGGLFGPPNLFHPDFTVLNGEVLFDGGEASGFDTGLWVTDGTALDTTEIGPSHIFGINFQPDFTVFNSEVLFTGVALSGGDGLWVTNGTALGTTEISGISGADSLGLDASDMTVFGEEVLFQGKDTSGLGLWVTNCTAAGTHELTGISGARNGSVEPFDLTDLGGKVLFEASDTSSHIGLWVTNGAAAGTSELTGISGAYASGIFGNGPYPDFTVLNGFLSSKVLFVGEDTTNAFGLWVTNGTAAGTFELTGISGAAAGGLDPSNLTVLNGGSLLGDAEVLFSGTDASGHVGLWVTDGASGGTSEITGIAGTGLSGISPSNLAFVTVTVPPPDDFAGNNTSDLLFRDTTSGDTWVEVFGSTLRRLNQGPWDQIGGSDTSYCVAGTGDFYGTGASDVLFRNNSTGDTWFEAISNGGFAGWSQIGGSDTHYSVVGTGDFTGYGTSDILFRNNSTGDTWFEAISNGAFDGWHQIGGSNTNYSVAGIGDFFDSGVDDILFRNNSTGDTWVEAITNGGFAGWDQIGGSNTTYSVVGVGDFGNGTDDILFRNNSTGDTWYEALLPPSGSFIGWLQIGGSNTSYSIVGIGDYFTTNTSDIAFRNNSTGDTWVEAISGGSFAGWNQIGGSNTSYSVPITVGPPALT
jgi:ELWxxDGT repeat protein